MTPARRVVEIQRFVFLLSADDKLLRASTQLQAQKKTTGGGRNKKHTVQQHPYELGPMIDEV
jgi:hypothetical protein